MFRLIVFDLDGTLVDSRRDIADAANALLAVHGAEPLPEERIGRMVGEGAAALVSRAFEAVGVAQPPDALARYLDLYRERLLRHTRPYPGVGASLERLSGRAALAVLTNKPLDATRQILEGLGLSRYFLADRVIGGDGPWPRKPDPGGLRHLMALTGVAPDATVLVGDSPIDWHTARAAGTHICVARYGFGFNRFESEPLGTDDLGADDPADLTSLI
jgi:phosphoglycolate phosphatase